MFQLGSQLEFIQAFPFLLSLLFLGLIFYLTSVMNTAEPRRAELAAWLAAGSVSLAAARKSGEKLCFMSQTFVIELI